jgi:hypothetical protein
VIAAGQGEHHRPRSREGTHPDRSSCVRNAETPPGSSPAVVVAGGLTVRDADRPGGRRMTKKRMPVAERRQETIAADQSFN